MRIERELMRSAGPLAVLKLLERGEMYGYELAEAVGQRTQGVMDIGESTLYPMLYNLEAKGFIQASWRDGDLGRQRKYYRLTGKGKKRIAEDSRQWAAVAGAMRALGVLGCMGTAEASA